ncbi:hypothetical protein QLG07_18735 [Erwinia sp. V90_4]|nr:hypothetical protein [Erwinia sp. V90_4]MDI3441505.1 hypothetical protein [Erwinia sp. V90_4]
MAEVAERVIAEQQMNLVMIGRVHLANPYYTYALAKKLNIKPPSWVLPAPYAHWLKRYRLAHSLAGKRAERKSGSAPTNFAGGDCFFRSPRT